LVEFKNPEQIREQYPQGVRDLADGGTWDTSAGQLTDDSEMALALARVPAEHGRYDPQHARRAYLDWFHSRPFDVGNTVSAGLRGHPRADSQANGAIMRASPLGIFGAFHSLERVAEWACQDSPITHIHPLCREANALYVMAIARAFRSGCSAGELYGEVINWAEGMANARELLQAVPRATEAPPTDYLGSPGWVSVAFQNALWQLLHARERGCQASAVDRIQKNALAGFERASSIREMAAAWRKWFAASIEEAALLQSGKRKKIVVRACRLVTERLQSASGLHELCAKTVAAQIGLSRSHCNRIFKQETGETFARYYLIAKRIEPAQRLLLDPACNVSQVAERCGYKDASYLAKVFRRFLRCSPMESCRDPAAYILSRTTGSSQGETPRGFHDF